MAARPNRCNICRISLVRRKSGVCEPCWRVMRQIEQVHLHERGVRDGALDPHRAEKIERYTWRAARLLPLFD